MAYGSKEGNYFRAKENNKERVPTTTNFSLTIEDNTQGARSGLITIYADNGKRLVGTIPRGGRFIPNPNATDPSNDVKAEFNYFSSQDNITSVKYQAIITVQKSLSKQNQNGTTPTQMQIIARSIVFGPQQGPNPGGTQDPPVLPLNPAAAARVTATSDVTLSVTENKLAFAKDKQILKYPLKHTSQNYDYIKITPMKYEPGLDFKNINPKNDFSFERIQNRITTPSGSTIFLPMVPGITESNSVGWGEDSLNPIQVAFGQAAGSIINDPNKFTLQGAFDNITDLMNTAKDFITKPKLQSAITAMFAGQAVGANFLGRSGIVINPNLELLFTGPKLRTFSYNFKFTPRSRDEAVEIRTIIKVLKKSMAVGHTQGELFLQVPSVFDIKYIYYGGESGGKEHPFMNKIKPCALTGLNVDYTPDGSYMTYGSNNRENPDSKGSGSMTSYGLSLQFSELEPIYNEDLGDVNDPTMGY